MYLEQNSKEQSKFSTHTSPPATLKATTITSASCSLLEIFDTYPLLYVYIFYTCQHTIHTDLHLFSQYILEIFPYQYWVTFFFKQLHVFQRMQHIPIKLTSIEEHLGCFRYFATTNSVAVNILVHISFCPVGIYLKINS